MDTIRIQVLQAEIKIKCSTSAKRRKILPFNSEKFVIVELIGMMYVITFFDDNTPINERIYSISVENIYILDDLINIIYRYYDNNNQALYWSYMIKSGHFSNTPILPTTNINDVYSVTCQFTIVL